MNLPGIKRGWHYNAVTGNLEAYNNGNEIFQYPFGTNYYVDGTNGSDTNSGKSWALAKATIQAALDLCSGRARNSVFVAPGGYAEDLSTPLDAVCRGGRLIAVCPNPDSQDGIVYLYGSTTHTLTIQGRDWLIDGFEIGAISGYGCIVIGGTATGNKAAGTTIQNCLVTGWGVGEFGIDFQNSVSSNATVTIQDNKFEGFNNAGNTAAAIKCSLSGIDQPRYCMVRRNVFVDSDNHIDMDPRGFKESVIKDNQFIVNGANYTALVSLDNNGGSANIVQGNTFSGTYSIAGGYKVGTNDLWSNYIVTGLTGANPA